MHNNVQVDEGGQNNPAAEENNDNSTSPQVHSKEDTDDKECRFKEGEELTFVRVRFPGNSRSFPFMVGNRRFAYGQKVLAMSDRGMDVGYINSFPYQMIFDKSMLPIRSISKVATDEDLQKQKDNIDKEREAECLCVDLVEKLGLDMNITHVETIQFGKKMVFYFNAPARVDFRDLVKQLVSSLKMRIELRQISVRDRAAALGSIGPCGLMTCCSSFLKNYGSVSIKMAKNQNLALIPSKLNGVCGQIKCCIKYEDEVYVAKRKLLPKEGVFIEVKNGDRGKVTRLHLIMEQFEMITDKGQIRRYARSQYDTELKLPEDWKFPTSFAHVVNESKIIIGLNDFDGPVDHEQISQDALDALNNDDHSYFDQYKGNSETDEEEDSEDMNEHDEQLNQEEMMADELALKKAQSLSLEDQEREQNQNGGNNNRNRRRPNNRRGSASGRPNNNRSENRNQDGQGRKKSKNRGRRNRNRNRGPNSNQKSGPTGDNGGSSDKQ